MNDAEVLFDARGVHRHFRLPRRSPLGEVAVRRAVDGVDFELRAGQSVGIVGESGSGKSTLVRILLALDAATAGTVTYRGRTVAPSRPSALRWFRSEVQVVFQDPLSSLDPRMTIEDIVAEPLVGLGVAGDHAQRVTEVLDAVQIDPSTRFRFPHEFSGGQQQRIAIARALAPSPRVLIADEPLSALDVSVRAQILDLLRGLIDDFDLSLVMVSHDLGVVNFLCDEVLVLYQGRCVERGATDEVFSRPQHDYTQRLLAAVPRLDA